MKDELQKTAGGMGIDLPGFLNASHRLILRSRPDVVERRSAGLLIGTNDLWIGCTARAADLPLLTRNPEHLSRIPGLQVLSYSSQPSGKMVP